MKHRVTNLSILSSAPLLRRVELAIVSIWVSFTFLAHSLELRDSDHQRLPGEPGSK
jgi:hypothetical protein